MTDKTNAAIRPVANPLVALQFAIALILGTANAALALEDWFTELEDDVFSGKTSAVLSGKLSGNQSLFVRCDNGRRLSVAFVFPSSFAEWIEGIPAQLALQVDDNRPIKLDVESYRHNRKYDGFRAINRKAAARFVRQLAPAERRVLVGIALQDQTDTFEAMVRGSSAAATSFAKACGINLAR